MGQVTEVIDETSKYMWRNHKNRLFMGIMIGLMLIYILLFAPYFNSHQDIDVESLEYDLVGNALQTEQSKEEGLIVPSNMTGTTAYIEQTIQFGQDRELYTTLQHGDAERYLENNIMAPDGEESTGLASLFYSLFANEPLFMKAPRLLEEVDDLNFHIIHEITSFQQIHGFLLGMGPLILLSGLIFIISDVHTKDQKLSSQKSGTPLSWQKYLLVQGLTALGFVLLFYFAFFGLFYLMNGLLHGFGSLSYPIVFEEETVGWFLLRTIPYFLLLLFLFTRLNTLVSLWTKQPIITMATLVFIVFSSTIYLDSMAADFIPFNLGYLPTSYIHFGQIAGGYHSLSPIADGLTVYGSGLLVLGLSVLVIEGLLFVSSKQITRQKFMIEGAG